MKYKNILGIIFALFILVIISLIFSKLFFGNISLFHKIPKIAINNNKFNLLVAKTGKEQEIGLSKYSALPKDQAMIFPFGKENYYGFWMKNMKFPIDIIFIRKGKVVTIYENVKPPKSVNDTLPVYQPTQVSDTVVEINAGLAKEQKIKTGDKISYENFSN
ncbi:MAG: hypothetical protein CO135_02995 [Candidatus Levybacteria bacterium CG_4_9_14_3_um_filter_35_16]|nr:MAG: hypothetical protein COW87_03660 [Candidatus Levybacteria bacterium CG22_combo_CG10-13_8_21_14_all_35_11]PIZ99473.1 MAG: hypothetical protein COX78_01795 [Candidatus Levybacteria bacterium CG_4_10_14_0_2_um_filter_35_8]PJA91102.1 MAG: hypothetical protein CO135_02995 [Candidatus Levybacteria bacterium CG_4_9_14_3_um_filter_35_16]PJC54459.1 MAG: hypothetical protein CO028_02185 [Candidatus Levybacteria bacterium CG_4_9_14_0_2_um_filter_35_21]